jgi:hypothetical protein
MFRLRFIPEFTQKKPLLRWALERQSRRSTIPVDLVRAYWTPPLTPKLAFEVERNQIEEVLGLTGLVSLTDHDTISAPTLLRVVEETSRIPFALRELRLDCCNLAAVKHRTHPPFMGGPSGSQHCSGQSLRSA